MAIDKVEEVFREVFEDSEMTLTPETTAKDVPEWDSFNHINLIVGLEDAFDISFSTEEMASMANVGDLVTLLQGKGMDVGW